MAQNLSGRKTQGWRQRQDLSRISSSLNQMALQDKRNLFELGTEQEESQYQFGVTRSQGSLQLKRRGMEYEKSLGQKMLSNTPTYGESFFNQFVPQAVQAGANIYKGHRQDLWRKEFSQMREEQVNRTRLGPEFNRNTANDSGLSWQSPQLGGY